ncbi:hypothetical protein C0992_006109 [Termitomyces sp. T32_za158]|nr:hypothetical protein C0992_006109 [Termitomyces sp. T32_za158]
MALRALQHAPITANEFARMFRKCTPPVGWSRNIGVANSGGPDSSCLLFLLHRHLSDEMLKSERPQQVFSLTVDHALQPTSAAMAEHCSKFAQRLGIGHVTSKVEWDKPPASDEPFEAVARAARYRALFAMMTEKNIDTLAFGHHIDDQVETSLIRLSWGSTNLGAAGMKYCRRWGMGLMSGASSEYGLEGMNRWIVRPLLDVSKTSLLPEDIVQRLMILETTARSLSQFRMSLDSSIEELRSGVRILSQQARDIDDMVDSTLKSCILPTFPGTFVISKFALDQVENLDVRRALVLRVLRYVSPYPWGSLNADGGRRKDSITRIIDQLWTKVTEKSRILRFTAGGRVLWTPIIIRGNEIKMRSTLLNVRLSVGDTVGWMASRLPPLSRIKLEHQGLPNTLEIDTTKIIIDAYQEWRNGGSSTVSILYDSRYLLEFYLDKMPQYIIKCLINNAAKENRLMVLPKAPWYTPKITLIRHHLSKTLHDQVSEEPTSIFSIPVRQYSAGKIGSDWIKTQWVRPLTAL